MKIIFHIAVLFGILFTACVRTEGTIKIQGKVIDESTEATIPFREVIVQGLVSDSGKLFAIYAGQFSTDSSGSFRYTLRKVRNAYHYNFCFVGDSDYAYMDKRVPLIPLERNAKELSFSLNRLVGLSIRISRVSKKPAIDTLLLSWKTNGVDGRTLYPYKINNYGLTSTSDLTWVGGEVKSTIKTRVFAGKKTILRWVLFRNKKTEVILDTIVCKNDQVNDVYLKY